MGWWLSLLLNFLKKYNFKWNGEAKVTFENLTKLKIEAPVLTMPDFTQPFILETNVCSNGIGAILMQKGQSISFF